ncbi:2-hydroxychromene-2-carboxylate isomerase [Limnohabitans sp. MMS-10A-178]|uniref:2-hydroxychromene-2-carboxylate isomerase n=1 Tax=Limnohabitans sp. MMS-10A-178 TaxID=1835767 RepID=UPI000D364A68|nr:DsbA family protein [Limnohabitans sp. MMS-10A-178]PUE16088.1 disulfide bond formation protein DsbA [Limnohabitans sp. MMS-10A-178]
MKEIHFYFDFISPYAWLAFQALPKALAGVSHRVHYHPVVFGAMLKHHGQLGPAEIPGKRDWTYRQVMWQAKQQGTDLQMPAAHPFNSLALLRLAVAASGINQQGQPNRYVVETIFKHVWCDGLEATDPDRLATLQAHLFSQPGVSFQDPQSAEVKQLLQQQTQQAIDLGLFGVPSMVVNGQVFWGNDALPMLRAYLEGDVWFESADWRDAGKLPVGIRRAPAAK